MRRLSVLAELFNIFDAGLEQRCHESLKEICEKISAAIRGESVILSLPYGQ